MDRHDTTHLFLGVVLTILATLSLFRGWHWILSVTVLVVLCIYIVILLLECAYHSKRPEGDESNRFFKLPNREWALLLVALFAVTNVFAFANVYLKTESIEYEVCDCNSKQKSDETKNCVMTLTDTTDAVYFSAVTVTTLGYGEFTPKRSGRILVVLHLASGLLLLLVLIPVAAARVSNW